MHIKSKIIFPFIEAWHLHVISSFYTQFWTHLVTSSLLTYCIFSIWLWENTFLECFSDITAHFFNFLITTTKQWHITGHISPQTSCLHLLQMESHLVCFPSCYSQSMHFAYDYLLFHPTFNVNICKKSKIWHLSPLLAPLSKLSLFSA